MERVADTKDTEMPYQTPLDMSESELEKLVEEAGRFDAKKAPDIGAKDRTELAEYMATIGCYERLSAKEELCLAASVQRGITAKRSLEGLPEIREDEKLKLKRHIEIGIAAREKLITSNLKLVVYAAYKAPWYCGTDLMDIIQDGNEGLIKAVDLFDPDKHCRFSTCAMYWIQAAIKKGGRRMAFQCYMSHRSMMKVAAVSRAAGRLESTGEKLSSERIAELAGVRERDVERLSALANCAMHLTRSYDDIPKEYMMHTEKDEMEEFVLSEIYREKLKAEVDKRLPPRQAMVVDMFYGLSGDEPLTLTDISTKLGISRQGAFTARERALKQLKHPAIKHAFRPFLS